MKLLHVVHSVDPAGGGVIEAVLQLVQAHQQEGHLVELASLDHSSNEDVRAFPCAVHPLGTGKPGYGYAQQLRSWLVSHGHTFDATILHGLWQYPGLAVWSALRHTENGYVVFPHGMLDPWFKHSYPLKHLKKWVYWNLIERRVLRDARLAVFTSEEERRLAPDSFRNFACRAAVVSLGTAAPKGNAASDRASFYRKFPELRGKRLLLFLGRIHEKKGCALLLSAFAQLCRKDPKAADVHLVLAGPCADASYDRELRKQAQQAFGGRSAPITWAGMLRGEEKWGAFHACDAFVLPSHQENFGLAVIEALACGVPVLISNKVNIWREIEKDQAGLIAEDSAAGTLRLLERWFSMGDPAQASMRSAAASCFRNRFEIGAAAQKLADLLARTNDHRADAIPSETALV